MKKKELPPFDSKEIIISIIVVTIALTLTDWIRGMGVGRIYYWGIPIIFILLMGYLYKKVFHIKQK